MTYYIRDGHLLSPGSDPLPGDRIATDDEVAEYRLAALEASLVQNIDDVVEKKKSQAFRRLSGK